MTKDQLNQNSRCNLCSLYSQQTINSFKMLIALQKLFGFLKRKYSLLQVTIVLPKQTFSVAHQSYSFPPNYVPALSLTSLSRFCLPARARFIRGSRQLHYDSPSTRLSFCRHKSEQYIIMKGKKDNWRKQKDEIFHDDSEEEEGGRQEQEEPQEGEVPSIFEEGEIVSPSQPENMDVNQSEQAEDVYDSSAEDESHLQAEKLKREILWRKREQEEQKMAGFSEEDILKKALVDVERTNKRVMLMRKKNLKRMEDIEKVRMTQQPYLTSTNTHFRGSTSQYPLVTTDRSGRTILHPNYSLRVNDIRLGDFIQKNIREQSSANYLNEVVKFENYAYQQRKKRRQHIQ